MPDKQDQTTQPVTMISTNPDQVMHLGGSPQPITLDSLSPEDKARVIKVIEDVMNVMGTQYNDNIGQKLTQASATGFNFLLNLYLQERLAKEFYHGKS